MAKETMKAKIARLEAELEHEKTLNDEIFEKLRVAESKLLEQNISDIEKNPLYMQMHQEMERYKLLFEQYKGLYEKSEEKRRKEHEDHIELYKQVHELKSETEKLMKQTERKHNERGAGRKSTITNQTKQCVRSDRANGMTIKQLSEKYGYSVGCIHKLISEQNNDMD